MAPVYGGDDRPHARHDRDGLGPRAVPLEGEDLDVGSTARARVRVERRSHRRDAARRTRDLPIRACAPGNLDAAHGHLSPDHECHGARLPAWYTRAPRSARGSTRRRTTARLVDVDEERYVEIWNHVFMQDLVDADEHVLGELPAKNIDTGSSLERVAMVLQGTDSYFETDLIRPLLEVAESMSGHARRDPLDDVSLKVIAEHARATTFLIADGVRRRTKGAATSCAGCSGASSGTRGGWGSSARDAAAGGAHGRTLRCRVPELRENEAFALQVASSEEDRFAATLRQGMSLFEEAKGARPASRDVRRGCVQAVGHVRVPLQLTAELAADAGLEVDTDRFGELLEEQRARAPATPRRRWRSASMPAPCRRPRSSDTPTSRPTATSSRCSTRRTGSCRRPRRGGGPAVPRRHTLLRGGRRADRRPGADPNRDRHRARDRCTEGRRPRDHAPRRRRVGRGPAGPGGARRGRPRTAARPPRAPTPPRT